MATNFAEYSYEKAITGRDRMNRALYVVGVIFLMILPILIAVFLHKYFIIYIMPLVVILGVPFSKFFFRYLQNEYKYTVDRNSFKIELIHGKAKPKLLYECAVSDMEFVHPASDHPDKSGFDAVSKCWVSENSPDLYVTAFRTSGNKRVLLYFEGCKKALKIMNYCNKNVKISQDLRH